MPQNVNRIQDVAVANVNEIVPTNWHRYPPRVGSSDPAYVRVLAYSGGVQGDDVDTATATLKYEPALGEASSYTPRTQAEKASTMVPAGSLAEDITRPRGWVEPDDPYTAKPGAGANPTITSLAPNTAVAVTGPDLVVVITGTNFTQWSTVTSGNFPIPVRYISPTKLEIIQKPRSSVAGTVQVKVVDHGVTSAGSNFVFT